MSKILLLLIVLVILAVILMVIFGWKGIGFGKAGDGGKEDGNDNGKAVTVRADGGEDNDEAQEAVGETAAESERLVEYADVTVTGGSYLYEGSVIELGALTEKLKGTDCVVRITDSEATQNAMEDLIGALEQENTDYIFSGEESLIQ